MLEGKEYSALDRAFKFVAAFFDLSTGYDRTASLTDVNTRYSAIMCDVPGGEGQRAWTSKALEMLDEILKAFKRMLVDTFHEHCNSGLCALKYHSLGHIADYLRKFGTFSVLDSGLYEQFNVHIKHSHRKTS